MLRFLWGLLPCLPKVAHFGLKMGTPLGRGTLYLIAALMMLARSALGDITTSPVASPNRLRANTPTGSSPNRLRCPKRLKTCHEQHEGSNQCLPSERIVVRATTVLEDPMRCPSAPKLRRA